MTNAAKTTVLVLLALAILALGLWQAGALTFLAGEDGRSGTEAPPAPEPASERGAGGLRGAPSAKPIEGAERQETDEEPVGVLVLGLGDATLRGLVTGGKAPLAHARVGLLLAPPDDGRAVRTAKDGRFEVRGLPATAGDLDLRCSAEGFVARTVRAPALAAGATADAGEIPLQPRGPMTDGLEVKVTDGAGRGVAGAKVTVTTLPYGLHMTLGAMSGMRDVKTADGATDEKGVARFFPLAAEKYDVIVRAEGHALAVVENVLVAAGRVEHVVVALAAGLTLSGTVVDLEGATVAGADVVTLAQPSFKMFEAVKSAADGSFTLTGLDPGGYWVMAHEDARGMGQTQGVKAGDRGVRIRLEGAGSVTGKVLAADGKPVAEFVLRPYRTEMFQYLYSRTFEFRDPEGRFSLSLPPGAYRIDAQAKGGAFGPGAPAVVNVGKTEEVTIRLPADGVVKGVVTDPDGNHLPDAEVYVSHGGFPPSPVPELYVRTGSDGAFRLAGLPLEPVKLYARHRAFATRLFDAVPAPEPAAREVTVRLTAGARVEGRVTNASGGPAEGERVTLSQGFDFLNARTVFTDAAGAYVCRGVAAGRWQVTLGRFENMAAGQQKTADVREGGVAVVDFRTEGGAGTGSVSGRVTTKGAPVANATVSASDARGFEQAVTVKTDADGRYVASGLEPGRITVYVETAEGFTVTHRVRLAAAGATAVLDVEFGASSIRGAVVAEGTNAAVSGAWVTVEIADPKDESGWESVRGQVSTDTNGVFTAGGLEAGTYRLRAWAMGFASRLTEPFAVGDGESKDVGALRLVTGAGIAGRVTDDSGKPVEGAGVSVADASAKPVYLFSMFSTGSDGRYEVRGLELGTYSVRFEAKGYAPVEKTVAVGAAGAVLDAVVARGGALAATVTDDAGRPVAGARIELTDAQGRKVTRTLSIVNLFDADASRTNAQGTATIPDLVPGNYTVRVSKEGMAQAGDPPSVHVPSGGTSSASVVLRAGP